MKTVLRFVLLVIGAVVLFFGWSLLNDSAQAPTTVPIRNQYDNKIVYGPLDDSITMADLQADCDMRDGVFSDCGSSCAPDAEICTMECALTCEWETIGGTPSTTGTGVNLTFGDTSVWEEYQNNAVGITIRHPAVVEINEEATTGMTVAFQYWGDTQTLDTEVFDGIGFTVERKSLNTGETLAARADSESAMSADLGDITEPVSATTVAGQESLTYSANTMGEYDIYFVPLNETDFLQIWILDPDPEDQGYEGVTAAMLQSLVVAE